MDETLLIVLSAIATGAMAGTSEAAKSAVVDAYEQLRGLLRQESGSRTPDATDPVTEYEEAMAAAQARLSERLAALGELSPQIRAQADEVVKAARKANYQVIAIDSQGIVSGSSPVVTMTFNTPYPAPDHRADSD